MKRIMESITGRNAKRQMESDLVNRALDVQYNARDNFRSSVPHARLSREGLAAGRTSAASGFRDRFLGAESATAHEKYDALKTSRKSPKVGEARPSRKEVKQAKTYAKVADKVANDMYGSPL